MPALADLPIEFKIELADDAGTPGAFAQVLTDWEEQDAPHLHLIDDLWVRVVNGERVLATVAMPPQHGKSRRLSQWGPAWAISRRPDLRIVIVSHAVSLARLFGRHARNLIEERSEFMGGLKLAEDRAAAHDFEVVDHGGGIYCVGIGGSLSGRPADVLILDDLIDNQAQAESPEVKQAIWNWLQTVAFARLAPGGSVLAVNTRWAEDDPIGMIHKEQPLVLDRENDRWEEIRLPALAEADDLLGRQEGEALWPWRYNKAYIEARKATMSPEMFSAQYQGQPIEPADSRMPSSKARTFRYVGQDGDKVELFGEDGQWRPTRILNRFATVDLAIGMKRRHDWSVVSTFGITPQMDLLWLGMHRERTEDQATLIQSEHAAFGGGHVVFIEGVAFQLETVKQARNKGLPALEAPGSHLDKVIRNDPVRAMWIAGKVYLPANAPWRPDALAECALFPRAAHDDIVDTLSYAGQVVSRGMVSVGASSVEMPDRSKKIPLRAIAGGLR